MTRGDLVIVDFRSTNPAAGVRPALVVQNDRDNARMRKTIVVQVTTNLSRVTELTQLLIDPTHLDWKRSGLKHPSAVACSNIYTIEQIDVARVIGSLSPSTMVEIEKCLKVAMSLS